MPEVSYSTETPYYETLSKQICSAERMIRSKRQQTEVKGMIIHLQTQLFRGLIVKI